MQQLHSAASRADLACVPDLRMYVGNANGKCVLRSARILDTERAASAFAGRRAAGAVEPVEGEGSNTLRFVVHGNLDEGHGDADRDGNEAQRDAAVASYARQKRDSELAQKPASMMVTIGTSSQEPTHTACSGAMNT
jgi:hypothetical protein